jgi:hypothetical protein
MLCLSPVEDPDPLLPALKALSGLLQAVCLFQYQLPVGLWAPVAAELLWRHVERVLTHPSSVDELFVGPQRLPDRLPVESTQPILTQRRDREVGGVFVEQQLEVEDVIERVLRVETPGVFARDAQP